MFLIRTPSRATQSQAPTTPSADFPHHPKGGQIEIEIPVFKWRTTRIDAVKSMAQIPKCHLMYTVSALETHVLHDEQPLGAYPIPVRGAVLQAFPGDVGVEQLKENRSEDSRGFA